MKRSYQSMPVFEEWKVIEGFPNYEVSNLGRVCSYKFKNNPKILSPTLHRNYLQVYLTTDERSYTKSIHRLVLIAFKTNPDPNYYNLCDHINRVSTDNRASNLRWSNTILNNLNRSSVRGYSFCKSKRKYRVRLREFGKDKLIGYFSTSYLARLAYLEAKRIYLKLIDSHHHK